MEAIAQACLFFLIAIFACWIEDLWEWIHDGQGCILSIAGVSSAITGAVFGFLGIAIITTAMEVHMISEIAIRLILAGLLFLLVGWLIDRGKWYRKFETASQGSSIGGVVFIIFGLLVGLAGILFH